MTTLSKIEAELVFDTLVNQAAELKRAIAESIIRGASEKIIATCQEEYDRMLTLGRRIAFENGITFNGHQTGGDTLRN